MTITQYELLEELNSLLWQYSVAHKGEPDYNLMGKKQRYIIEYWNDSCPAGAGYHAVPYSFGTPLTPYFDNEKIANDAIEKVVKPFMARHSEFVW